MAKHIHGVLLVDKPLGVSSHSVLQRVSRQIFNAKKAGHTGSLDPLATGMLPICFGEATKFSQFLLDSNKTYLVTGKLGITTTSGDTEGDVIERKPVENINADFLKAIMLAMIGEVDQVPPMYSALKHNGRPLYEFARQGLEVDRPARKINVFSMQLVSHVDDEFTFEVHCSKGTYVRTLVEEIGIAAGCGAHVTALRRLSVSPYENLPMYTIDELEAIFQAERRTGLLKRLLPLHRSVDVFPTLTLDDVNATDIKMGKLIRAELPHSFDLNEALITDPQITNINSAAGNLLKLMTDKDEFLGLGIVLEDGRVKPHRLVSETIKIWHCA